MQKKCQILLKLYVFKNHLTLKIEAHKLQLNTIKNFMELKCFNYQINTVNF